jgi:hypothetical protein
MWRLRSLFNIRDRVGGVIANTGIYGIRISLVAFLLTSYKVYANYIEELLQITTIIINTFTITVAFFMLWPPPLD